MILDSAKVSLSDGTQAAAISVEPGRNVLSFQRTKPIRASVIEKKIAMSADVIGLVLSSGQRLVGSQALKVAVYRKSNIRFVPLSEIAIGDHLSGEKAGMAVVVSVIGLLFCPRTQARLVGLQMDHRKPFVADGVLCRYGS